MAPDQLLSTPHRDSCFEMPVWRTTPPRDDVAVAPPLAGVSLPVGRSFLGQSSAGVWLVGGLIARLGVLSSLCCEVSLDGCADMWDGHCFCVDGVNGFSVVRIYYCAAKYPLMGALTCGMAIVSE
jgi:hypothetical protein